jgi:hypothetical protein
MKDAQFASALEIQALKEWISTYYSYNIGNDREIQDLNNRPVQLISYDFTSAQQNYMSSSYLKIGFLFCFNSLFVLKR